MPPYSIHLTDLEIELIQPADVFVTEAWLTVEASVRHDVGPWQGKLIIEPNDESYHVEAASYCDSRGKPITPVWRGGDKRPTEIDYLIIDRINTEVVIEQIAEQWRNYSLEDFLGI